jgi:hypothetical protein
MNPRLSPLASVTLLFVVAAPGSCQEKTKTSDLYPTAIGTVWRYRTAGNEILVRVAKQEKIDRANCALVESVMGDKVVASEHIAVQPDGLYRYTMAGQKADPPIRFLKLPAKKGDVWEVASKLGGQELKVTYETDEEEITVPAGKFRTVVTRTRDFQAAGQKMAAKIWYAKDVGMVKTEMTIAGNKVVIELEKYEPAK